VAAAERGSTLFAGKAGCATCHKPPTFSDVSTGPDPNVPVLHDPNEVGTDPRYAARSATKQYRTSPLRGIWQHPPYFHDGSAATLMDVVEHYRRRFKLNLSAPERADLVEFLKSL
jgi:cytochrome c peroxidase